jgi:hypothetical protein
MLWQRELSVLPAKPQITNTTNTARSNSCRERKGSRRSSRWVHVNHALAISGLRERRSERGSFTTPLPQNLATRRTVRKARYR